MKNSADTDREKAKRHQADRIYSGIGSKICDTDSCAENMLNTQKQLFTANPVFFRFTEQEN